MAVEKEIDLYHSEDFELDFIEKTEDTIKNVLDERDYIPPLKEIEEESSSPSEMNDSMETQEQDEEEIDIPSIDKDDQEVNPQSEEETDILLNENDEHLSDQSASAESEWDMQGEIIDPGEDDPNANGSEDEAVAPPAENHSANNWVGVEADAEEKIPETEEPFGVGASDIISVPEEKLPAQPAAESHTRDFVGQDDDVEEMAEKRSETTPPTATETKKEPGARQRAGKPSSFNKFVCLALIGMVITGFVLYFNPNLIGLTKAEKVETPAPDESVQPATPAPPPVTMSAQPSKRDRCMAKIADAIQLRLELLEKRDEIYELILHYQNGIAELENEIQQEIKKEGISSYKEAIKNTLISLKMRTIQRRLAYVEELTKPADWLISGREELYYLVRKAEVDMQLIEIAGGIDLNKHMRHISAAIQKYRPRPDKLAVDLLLVKPQPLEQIWQQVSAEKQKQIKLSLNPNDEIITNQICGGNFSRIAELTSITPRAAQCLSRMKGSDLFLNGLKTLTPDAAKRLFQWQGNWICLNGVSQLSEPVAQHLFKWKGNWISLNSLNEFPPELAKHLLKWEGQQLELMGLEIKKSKANKKTMKYLALWETTGGKLYVPDLIRRGMENLM